MRVGRQLLWWRPWTTTATNKRMTTEEKHRHHIECQNQQELPKWPLHVLWHVTQAPKGLHEHLDLCKEISIPHSWRDTFVEGFPIEASDRTWFFIKNSLWEKSSYHLPVAAVSYPVVDRISKWVFILVKNLKMSYFLPDRLSQHISFLSKEYEIQFPWCLFFI